MTGYHRKYAIAVLRAEPSPPRKRRRKRRYGAAVQDALAKIWREANYPCAPRLKAMLPQWLPFMPALEPQTRTALERISPRSIDRLLQAKRSQLRRRIYSHTRPGALLKQIPVRTERWDVSQPGWCELDLVAHCGPSGGGEFINSLNMTDIASSWTETRAICGKGQYRVIAAIDEIRHSLPFELRGIDSDSGGEFINHQCVRYCNTKPKLEFTRSRPFKKNDNAHIEQKNYTHVRKIFGWERFEGQAAVDAMNDLYANELRTWMNFFQPSMKLVEKRRIGSRVIKKYDAPRAPLDRLIALNALPAPTAAALLAQRSAINPFELARRIERKVHRIMALASVDMPWVPPRPQNPLAPFNRKQAAIRRAAHGAAPGKILNGETIP